MSIVLITLLALVTGCMAAALSGVVDRRTLTGLVGSCKRMVSHGLSFLAELGHNGIRRNLAGKSKRSGSFDEFVSRISCGAKTKPSADLYAPLNKDVLNCRVLMTELKDGDNVQDAFAVEICGTIHAPNDMRRATLKISILDVTGDSETKRVLEGTAQAACESCANKPEFRYIAELGRLPGEVTRLEDWTAVAQLRTDGQAFPRRGQRTLQFKTAILSAEGGRELAGAGCKFVHDISAPGYMDLQENAERAKVLTVALAFAVSAADDRLYECEIELIKQWARENVLDDPGSMSGQSRVKLEKALSKTIAFFSEGNKLDTLRLCEEIAEIATAGQRYEVLDLCLRVARAKGSVTAEEMGMLKGLANQIEIDAAKFRAMVEKILPVEIHEVMNIDDILGITSDMSSEKTRRHLNKEYSKWNSRVTSANPQIQSQADQMLKLIAEARGKYVAEDSDSKTTEARE